LLGSTTQNLVAIMTCCLGFVTSDLQVVCDTQFCCNAVLKGNPIPDECSQFNMISVGQKLIFSAQNFCF
jgi:hypothetical protein